MEPIAHNESMKKLMLLVIAVMIQGCSKLAQESQPATQNSGVTTESVDASSKVIGSWFASSSSANTTTTWQYQFRENATFEVIYYTKTVLGGRTEISQRNEVGTYVVYGDQLMMRSANKGCDLNRPENIKILKASYGELQLDWSSSDSPQVVKLSAGGLIYDSSISVACPKF